MNQPFITTIDNLQLGLFDLGGVLYHANYFVIYERAREDFLRSIALPYSDLVKENYHLAVIDAELQYKKPIRYGNELVVELYFSEIGKASFQANYNIFSSRKSAITDLLHHGRTKHVFVKTSPTHEFEICPLPEQLKKALHNFPSKMS
ncbi:acyl-CoA thioesterase [bacterium]|nr:acyl-CoA thioesterase [bacterium]